MCTGCRKPKLLDDFRKDARRRDGHGARCKACLAAQGTQYRQANLDKRRAYDRQRGTTEGRKASARQYKADHQDEIALYYREWYAQNRDRKLALLAAGYDELRAAVFGHYGCCCACCGITADLTIDHVDGTGAQHRQELFGKPRGVGGVRFYKWLVEQEFPEGYQVLCRSCNSSKRRGGRCRLVHGESRVSLQKPSVPPGS
jgi:RNA polymerase-binding transcription factor DksA